jgi:hypothetical protein
MNQCELFNVAMCGVRDGVHIDDSLADGEAKVVEEAGERVGDITNSKNAAILKELAIKRREHQFSHQTPNSCRSTAASKPRQ